MIISVENQTLYIDGNSAGSLMDALPTNFPNITQELWVIWNTQNIELAQQNSDLSVTINDLNTQLTGKQSVIDAMQVTIDELNAQLSASNNPGYIELSAPKFYILLDHEQLNGVPLSTVVAQFMATQTNNDLRYFFERSATFRSNDSMVLGVGALLGLSEQNIHDLFVLYQDYVAIV